MRRRARRRGGAPVPHTVSGAGRRGSGHTADRALWPAAHGAGLAGSALFQRPCPQRHGHAGAGCLYVAAGRAHLSPGARAAQRRHRRLLPRHAAGGLFLAALLRSPHLSRRKTPAQAARGLSDPLPAQRRAVRFQHLDGRCVLSGRGQCLPSRRVVRRTRRGGAQLFALRRVDDLAACLGASHHARRARLSDAVHGAAGHRRGGAVVVLWSDDPLDHGCGEHTVTSTCKTSRSFPTRSRG